MTWPTEQAREAVPCTRVCDDSGRVQQGMRHTSGCDEHRLAILAALAPHVAALVRAERAAALREAVDLHAITIPDALGYKVAAVAVEDLLNLAEAEDADR